MSEKKASTIIPNFKVTTAILILITTVLSVLTVKYFNSTKTLQKKVAVTDSINSELEKKFTETSQLLQTRQAELTDLKNQDQYVINKKLEADIKQIEKTYGDTVLIYEKLLDVKDKTKKTEKLDKQFASILSLLSKRNYSSATASLKIIKTEVEKLDVQLSSSFAIPANVATNNTAPGSGYSRQKVDTEVGSFLVDIIAADLNSTRVIVDTASDSDCRDNCPVLPLSEYVARSGGFAGINGPYFCPASYPSCAGKTNTFDTLMMNKKKTYFNSDNNIYSSVPAVIFTGSSARFVGASREWGRDTSPDSVIAAQPMLLSGGNIVYGSDSEAKRLSAGNRSFIGTKASTIYIGVVHNANVAQVARVLKTLGLEYALNLDSGGSTALMTGSRYVAGPGRALPFGIVLVRK